MQILNCNVGTWKAQAKISEVGKDKLMASILAVDQQGAHAESAHTIVFDRKEGIDDLEQASAVVSRLLRARYGA